MKNVLFATSIPVKGYLRSAIYDLNRCNYDLIPNAFYSVLKEQSFANWNATNVEGEALEYYQFLRDKDHIFEEDKSEVGHYPPLSLDYEYPYIITNTIIYLSKGKDYTKTIELLDAINCVQIAIVSEEVITSNDLKAFLELTNDKCFASVEIRINYSELITIAELEELMATYLRISEIILYNFPENLEVSPDFKYKIITHKHRFDLKEPIHQDPYFFIINMPLFFESQAFHTYFNKKLFIGKNGELKNTPETEAVFGYIDDVDSLEPIVTTKEFTTYWNANKDKCDVCKDCEFRHMCIDNRVPIKRNGKDEWYFNTPCDYNPYIGKWANEAGYKDLESCGVYSTSEEVRIDEEVLNNSIKHIWE